MNWNNPDSYPGESEEEYEARKRSEVKASTGLIFMITSFLLFLFKIAAIFGIFMYAGYFLARKFLGEQANKLEIWGFAILFTYLVLCFIYFFKGIIIGLRSKNKKLWIVFWIVCVVVCCVMPAFVMKSLVLSMFNPIQREELIAIGISWGVFILALLYIYNIYQFKTANAPRVLYWSYALGYRICR